MANIKSFIALILTATISFSCGPSPEEFEVMVAAAIEETMAAKPTMTNTPEPLATQTPARCDRTEYLAKVDSTLAIVKRFGSARQIADVTGRGALTPVMLQLDQIYWEMSDLAMPECLQLYKAYTLSYMESSIEAFKDFKIEGAQMDDWLAQALHALETANELLEVTEAESLTGIPPDLMDLPGVPLPTDTLNSLQSGYRAIIKSQMQGDITTLVTVETVNSAHMNGWVHLDIHLQSNAFYGNDKLQKEIVCPLVLDVHEVM